MSITDILSQYFKDGQFSDLFIQMFVNSDNSFAYLDFNRVHSVQFTHKQIQAGIKELTGNKVVLFSTPEFDLDLMGEFTKLYQFGQYTHVKDWNLKLFEMFGEVLPRTSIYGYVSRQKPKRSTKAFLPSHDGNLYAKDEFVSKAIE